MSIDFDADELRDRYRSERDKRLRADANEQYQEIAGEFAHYLEDPYVQPLQREAVVEEVEVGIVGGGFGGMLIAARLREQGIGDFRLIEKGRRLRWHLVLESLPRCSMRC